MNAFDDCSTLRCTCGRRTHTVLHDNIGDRRKRNEPSGKKKNYIRRKQEINEQILLLYASQSHTARAVHIYYTLNLLIILYTPGPVFRRQRLGHARKLPLPLSNEAPVLFISQSFRGWVGHSRYLRFCVCKCV